MEIGRGIDRVAQGVFLVRSTAVNWVLVSEGDTLLVVDTGYPRDLDALLASVHAVGHRPEDVAAVLVTHAHVDHVGALPGFLARHPVPVLTGPGEAAHARRERLEQAAPLAVVARAWRPRWLRWGLQVVRSGALRDTPVPTATEAAPGPLDLPGTPVAVPTPGHTSGHTAWHLPRHGVVVSGDALVTAHPTTPRTGPQLLDPLFHHDTARAAAALAALAALDADVLLPGHGPAHHGPVADAVARVRAAAR